MKLTCHIRRFLARTFRPVLILIAYIFFPPSTLQRIPLGKRPKRAKYQHLLKTDLNSGTRHAQVFGCVSGQDVVGSLKTSSRKDAQYQN